MSAEPFELDDVTSNRDCDLIPPSSPAGPGLETGSADWNQFIDAPVLPGQTWLPTLRPGRTRGRNFDEEDAGADMQLTAQARPRARLLRACLRQIHVRGRANRRPC